MESKKEKLESLPASDDKEWGEAEIQSWPLKEPKKCEHYFMYLTAGQVKCKNCHIGFFLGIGDSLKEGHLYRQNKLVL